MAVTTGPALFQPGGLVRIHSLKSDAGRKVNGQRGVVIRFVESEGRFEIRVESERQFGATKALKPENLTPIDTKLPLPTGFNRGNASPSSMESMIPKLCELLLYYKGGGPHNPSGDFQPSEIMFQGYGAMAFSRMGESNFMCFTPVQMEQMGGVLGLGNICLQGDEFGTADVMFGLLEGDPMYLDVLIQTMSWTGCIMADTGIDMETPPGYSDCPPTRLTPDQDTQPYIKTMSEGPVMLLEQMSKYKFAPAFWAALSKSEFYHLLIQRLLRWIAREGQKTRDGKVLGKKARKILSSMFPDCAGRLSQPIKNEQDACSSILERSTNLLLQPEDVSVEKLKVILGL